MRIAFLAPEFILASGGVGIYSVSLVKELSKHYDIHVITPRRGDQDESDIEDMFDGRIKVHFVTEAKDTFFYNLKFQLALLKEFPRLHKKYGFDLVHSANLVQMPDIFLLLRGLSIPHVVTAHTTIRGQMKGIVDSKKKLGEMSPSERYSILFYPFISFLERLYLSRAKNVIAISESYMKIIKSQYRLKNTYIINNGIDIDMFRDSKKASFGKSPVVLFVGRMNVLKGLFVLSKAIKKVLSVTRDVQFVFCGQGKETLINSLSGIPKSNVTYLGVVDNNDLSGIYSAADIFVLPSYTENMPLVIMEAMMSRCAVVASNVGGIPEMISDGEDGMLIEAGDWKGLADRILGLLKDKKGRKRIQAAANKRAIRDFTLERMAKRTKEVYEEIANGI